MPEQHNNAAQPILPHLPSLLPKNSLGALLLDFRASPRGASLQAPSETYAGQPGNGALGLIGHDVEDDNDLEDVLRHLTAALNSGDLDALNQELEAVGFFPLEYAWQMSIQRKCVPGMHATRPRAGSCHSLALTN